MSEKKTIVLPRLVFAKDKKTGKGYARQTLHPNFRASELDIFSRIKSQFEWPSGLQARLARDLGNIYPDCYGLYRLEEGRYFLLRFRDEGYDESGRPHTVSYEVALYEAPRETAGAHGVSRSLASLLDPGAWLESDTAAFEPVDAIDGELDERIKAWLSKKPEKLFIYAPRLPARKGGSPPPQAESSAPRQAKSAPSQAESPAGGFYRNLCVFFLILVIVLSASSAWLFRERNRYSAQARRYEITLADRSNEHEVTRLREEAKQLEEEKTRLRDQLDRIQKILDER